MTGERPRAGPLSAQGPRPERQIAFRTGISAESRAAAFLIAKGFRILARRWRSPVGEIDIIARRRSLLVFVEVKARERLDDAAWSVSERQRRRIIAAAEAWLAQHADDRIRDIRLDVMLVAPGGFRTTSRPPSTPAPNVHSSDDSRRVQLLEKRIDLAADAGGDLAEVFRDGLHRAGVVTGGGGGFAHPRDLVGGLARALSRGLDAARDLLGGGTLLGDGGRDGTADRADLADGALDGSDGLDRAHGRVLHAGDLRADVLGCLGGLAGKRLDLAGDDGETAAGVPRPRRLDRGVEREQVGLLGDVGDEPDDVADAAGGLVELLDPTLVRSASLTALLAMAFDCATWRSISDTEAASSSAADAISRTLAEASADDVAAPCVLVAALSAAPDRRREAASIWSEIRPSSESVASTSAPNRPISTDMSSCRRARASASLMTVRPSSLFLRMAS